MSDLLKAIFCLGGLNPLCLAGCAEVSDEPRVVFDDKTCGEKFDIVVGGRFWFYDINPFFPTEGKNKTNASPSSMRNRQNRAACHVASETNTTYVFDLSTREVDGENMCRLGISMFVERKTNCGYLDGLSEHKLFHADDVCSYKCLENGALVLSFSQHGEVVLNFSAHGFRAMFPGGSTPELQ